MVGWFDSPVIYRVISIERHGSEYVKCFQPKFPSSWPCVNNGEILESKDLVVARSAVSQSDHLLRRISTS